MVGAATPRYRDVNIVVRRYFDKVANPVLVQLGGVARHEPVNPEFAHESAQTMCKNHSSTGLRRSTNADNPDRIELLYKQTDGE
jgi:hypothetical protein